MAAPAASATQGKQVAPLQPKAQVQSSTLPLPQDAVLHALSFMPPQEMITTIPLVNREFSVLSKDELYWSGTSLSRGEIPISQQERNENKSGKLTIEDYLALKAKTLLVGDIHTWRDYFVSQCKKRKIRIDQDLSIIKANSGNYWDAIRTFQCLTGFRVGKISPEFEELNKAFFARLSAEGISPESQARMKGLVEFYSFLRHPLTMAFILDDPSFMSSTREFFSLRMRGDVLDDEALEIFNRDFSQHYKYEVLYSTILFTDDMRTFENMEFFLQSLKDMGLTLHEAEADKKHMLFNMAIRTRKAQVVTLVEALGGEPNERSLKVAIKHGMIPLAERLSQGMEFDDDDPSLFVEDSLESGSLEMFQWVLSKMPGVDIDDYEHLEEATIGGNPELVRLLLERPFYKALLKKKISQLLKIALKAKNKPMVDFLADKKKPSRLISAEDKHELFAHAIKEKDVALINFLGKLRIFPGKRAFKLGIKTKDERIIISLVRFCRFIPNVDEILTNAHLMIPISFLIPYIKQQKSMLQIKDRIEAKLKNVETDPDVKESEASLLKSLETIKRHLQNDDSSVSEIVRDLQSDSSDSESELEEESKVEAPSAAAPPDAPAAEDSDSSGED